MARDIRIYFEGSKALRPGFNKFLRELARAAKSRRVRLDVIAGRDRANARKDFERAKIDHADSWCILLIDSEGPPPETHEGSTFWMVEMMEAWFHADKDALAAYYGRDFRRDALAQNQNVEQIPKAELRSGLSNATKDSGKGDYFRDKVSHAAALLDRIKPELVKKAAPNCNRLFVAVLAHLNNAE